MGLIGLMIMTMFDIIAYTLVSKKITAYETMDRLKRIALLLVFSFTMAAFRWYLFGQYYIVAAGGFDNQIIIFILIFIMNKCILLSITFDYLAVKNRVFKYLLSYIFVILIAIWFYQLMDIDGVLDNIISIFVLSTGIIHVNLVVLREGLKNKHKEKQKKIYEDYLPVINELIAELRAKQHEFDNHIQALNMLTVTGTNYEDVVNSMKTYINEIESNNELIDLIKLDNRILAGFLYSKMKRAKELNIKFQITMDNYEFRSKLKDYELIEVIGNLIDNGFETGVEDNIVILILEREEDMNIIEVRNKHPYLKSDYIAKMFNKGFSTKSDSDRGCGLYNVKDIVNKYNGEIEVFNKRVAEDNYVIFRILFSRN